MRTPSNLGDLIGALLGGSQGDPLAGLFDPPDQSDNLGELALFLANQIDPGSSNEMDTAVAESLTIASTDVHLRDEDRGIAGGERLLAIIEREFFPDAGPGKEACNECLNRLLRATAHAVAARVKRRIADESNSGGTTRGRFIFRMADLVGLHKEGREWVRWGQALVDNTNENMLRHASNGHIGVEAAKVRTKAGRELANERAASPTQ